MYMYVYHDRFTGGQDCGWGGGGGGGGGGDKCLLPPPSPPPPPPPQKKPCICMYMYTLYCSTCAYLSVVCAVCVLAPEICGDWPLCIPHAPHLRVHVCVCTCVCEECPSYTAVYIVYMCTSLRPYRVLIVVGSVHHCTSLYM